MPQTDLWGKQRVSTARLGAFTLYFRSVMHYNALCSAVLKNAVGDLDL